jgi:lactoylglutathione lyase
MGSTHGDGNEWEFFYTKADVDEISTNAEKVECCSTTPQSKNTNN